MNLIQVAIRQPVSTFAIVILIGLFGTLGLLRLPIQLTPDVEAPTIAVNTTWAGASPYDIEKEIIEKQEEVLKSIQGLVLLESSSYNSLGSITLTFQVGTDLQNATVRVDVKPDRGRTRACGVHPSGRPGGRIRRRTAAARGCPADFGCRLGRAYYAAAPGTVVRPAPDARATPTGPGAQ